MFHHIIFLVRSRPIWFRLHWNLRGIAAMHLVAVRSVGSGGIHRGGLVRGRGVLHLGKLQNGADAMCDHEKLVCPPPSCSSRRFILLHHSFFRADENEDETGGGTNASAAKGCRRKQASRVGIYIEQDPSASPGTTELAASESAQAHMWLCTWPWPLDAHHHPPPWHSYSSSQLLGGHLLVRRWPKYKY